MATGGPTQAEVDRLLRIGSYRTSGALVLTVAGEIDTFTAAKLDDALTALLNQTTGPLVIDLADVAFLGSRGLSVLVEASRRATRHHRRLHLVAGDSMPVRRPIQVLGLTETLPLYETIERALGSC